MFIYNYECIAKTSIQVIDQKTSTSTSSTTTTSKSSSFRTDFNKTNYTTTSSKKTTIQSTVPIGINLMF